MIQTIHEIQDPFDVYVKKLGYGLAKFMFAGSSSSNPQYLVKLYHSGDHRVVDMVDIKEYGNPNAGEALVPPIPQDWLVKS
jgi:hypothetical protein